MSCIFEEKHRQIGSLLHSTSLRNPSFQGTSPRPQHVPVLRAVTQGYQAATANNAAAAATVVTFMDVSDLSDCSECTMPTLFSGNSSQQKRIESSASRASFSRILRRCPKSFSSLRVRQVAVNIFKGMLTDFRKPGGA